MTGIEVVITQVHGLDRGGLDRWILNDWVRPDGPEGAYAFREIDIAHIRLIHELRNNLNINEEALPVLLLLLDQIYTLRRQLRM